MHKLSEKLRGIPKGIEVFLCRSGMHVARHMQHGDNTAKDTVHQAKEEHNCKLQRPSVEEDNHIVPKESR